jgi:hypothetical protein
MKQVALTTSLVEVHHVMVWELLLKCPHGCCRLPQRNMIEAEPLDN